MKKILLFPLLFISLLGSAQDALKFTDIVTVENISQKELFGRAKIWLAKYYKSSKDVIQTADPETGQILGKALFAFLPKSFMGSEAVKGNINYIMSIYCKDGKYKYVVEDFRHEKFGMLTTAEEGEFSLFGSSKGFKKKTWEDMKKQSEEEAKSLSESLKMAMGKKSEADF
jgi:Domain of unknown function (DUF4468) with TBP-like fold